MFGKMYARRSLRMVISFCLLGNLMFGEMQIFICHVIPCNSNIVAYMCIEPLDRETKDQACMFSYAI